MRRRSRLCGVLVASALAIIPNDKPAAASEAWTCFTVIKDKKIPTRYVVNGQILLHGDGSSHSKILIDDDRLLISSATYTSSVVRHPKNSAPVEIDEPIVTYFVMDKYRNKMFTLSNYLAPLMLDSFDKLIDPDMDAMDCTKD
jgi:hypothetical protein